MSQDNGVVFNSVDAARAAFAFSKEIRFHCNVCGSNHTYSAEKDTDVSRKYGERKRPIKTCLQSLFRNIEGSLSSFTSLHQFSLTNYAWKNLGREELRVTIEKDLFDLSKDLNLVKNKYTSIKTDYSSEWFILSLTEEALEDYLHDKFSEIKKYRQQYDALRMTALREIYEKGKALFSNGAPHESVLPLYYLKKDGDYNNTYFINKTQPYNSLQKIVDFKKSLGLPTNYVRIAIDNTETQFVEDFFNNRVMVTVYYEDYCLVVCYGDMWSSSYYGDYSLLKCNNYNCNDVTILGQASFKKSQNGRDLIEYFEL